MKVKKNNERIGNKNDRIYKDSLKNRKLKIIYQEWQFGLITKYYKSLDEHRIAFDDGTEDYINLNSGDSIEIILQKTFWKLLCSYFVLHFV